MEDNIVTLRTFDNPVLAHVIRARLEAMEIPCFLADEHMISLNPLFNPAIGGIKLKVFEKDYHRSLALLDEDQNILSDDNTEAEDTSISCPACQSKDVGYGNATKKRFGLLTILLSFVLMVYPFYSKKAWHCYNCGEEFSE